MDAHHAIDGISLFLEKFGGDLQFIGDVDALNDEDVAFFLDLADGVGFEIAFSCRDTARLKGAAERAGHSTAGRGYDVVERRSVGFGYIRADAVVLCNFGVNTEFGRAVNRQMGDTQRAFDALQSDMRTVRDSILSRHVLTFHESLMVDLISIAHY